MMIKRKLLIKRVAIYNADLGCDVIGFSGLEPYAIHSVRDVSMQTTPVTQTGFAMVEVEFDDSILPQLQADPEIHIVNSAKLMAGDFSDAAQFSIDNGVSITQLENDVGVFKDNRSKMAVQGIANKRKQMGV